MATIVAIASGNWSDTSATSPWPGGVKPGAGDTVQPGEFVIEIDEDITVALLESPGGGNFIVSTIAGDGTRTITASLDEGNLIINNATGQVNLSCNVIGGGSSSPGSSLTVAPGANVGTIVAGTIAGGGNSLIGIVNYGTIGEITAGEIYGGDGNYGHGIYNVDSGVIDAIYGDTIGGGEDGYYACGIFSEGIINTVCGMFASGGAGKFSFALDNENPDHVIVVDGLFAAVAGLFPIFGRFAFTANPSPDGFAIAVQDENEGYMILSSNQPNDEDVRAGVTYALDSVGALLVGVPVVGGRVSRRG